MVRPTGARRVSALAIGELMVLQDVLAIVLVAAAGLVLLRRAYRSFRGHGGCGCGGGESQCTSRPKLGIERQPFVPLDQLSRSAQTTAPESADSESDLTPPRT